MRSFGTTHLYFFTKSALNIDFRLMQIDITPSSLKWMPLSRVIRTRLPAAEARKLAASAFYTGRAKATLQKKFSRLFFLLCSHPTATHLRSIFASDKLSSRKNSNIFFGVKGQKKLKI